MRLAFPLTALICALAISGAKAQTDSSDFRHQRKWAVSGEVGLNSLSSLVGPMLTCYVMPSLAVDAGAGLSVSGLRPGVRARYLFTPKDKASFYGGLGLKTAFGSGEQDLKAKDVDTKEEFRFKTNPTDFLDFMLGVEFLANNGFLVMGNAGYSQLLTSKPYEITVGAPGDKTKKAFDTIFGSGIMLSISLGIAF